MLFVTFSKPDFSGGFLTRPKFTAGCHGSPETTVEFSYGPPKV